MSDAMRDSGRLFGIALAVGTAGALVIGAGVGLAQDESVLRWVAYMFSILGAITIGFACFSGAPTSARKHVAKRMRKPDDPPEPEVPEVKPYVSEVVILFAAGLLLVAVGTGLELVF